VKHLFVRRLIQNALESYDFFLHLVLAAVHVEQIAKQDYPANGEGCEQIWEV